MISKVKLNTVCEIRNGYAFKSEDFQDSGIPLIRISNFDDGIVSITDNAVYLDEKYLSTKKDFIVENGDVLIALSGATTGKYGIYTLEFPSLLNQRIGLLKSGTSKYLWDKYFYYYLGVLKDEILRKAGGAAQPNISTKTIGELEIPLPPIEEQKKIAALLDAADSLRQKDKALIAKYDELTQSLFLEMFGDPVRNEKGWETKTGKEYCLKISVGVVIKPAAYYEEDGVIALRAMNIRPNRIVENGFVFFSEKNHTSVLAKSIIYKDDVLIVRTGSTGTAVVVPPKYDNCNCIDSIIARPNLKLINPLYLSYFFNSERGKELVTGREVGGIQKHFNIGTINNLQIIVPPIQLQNQFAERVKAIEKQKEIAQAGLKKSEELFEGLLGMVFRNG